MLKKKWYELLFDTSDSNTIAFQRIIVGVIFFAHGAQKMLGWFGGYGYSGTMGFFTNTLGIPAIFGFLAIMAEFFGSIGLITGLLTRISAFALSVVMIVAVVTTHFANGFFMNWSGQAAGEGYEYHLLALALLLVLVVKGAGNFSFDKLISERKEKSVQGYDLRTS